MNRHWNRNVVYLASSVMTVVRWPISCTNSMAMLFYEFLWQLDRRCVCWVASSTCPSSVVRLGWPLDLDWSVAIMSCGTPHRCLVLCLWRPMPGISSLAEGRSVVPSGCLLSSICRLSYSCPMHYLWQQVLREGSSPPCSLNEVLFWMCPTVHPIHLCEVFCNDFTFGHAKSKALCMTVCRLLRGWRHPWSLFLMNEGSLRVDVLPRKTLMGPIIVVLPLLKGYHVHQRQNLAIKILPSEWLLVRYQLYNNNNNNE